MFTHEWLGVQVGRGCDTCSGAGEELLVPLDYVNTWMGPLGVRSGFACLFPYAGGLWQLFVGIVSGKGYQYSKQE